MSIQLLAEQFRKLIDYRIAELISANQLEQLATQNLIGQHVKNYISSLKTQELIWPEYQFPDTFSGDDLDRKVVSLAIAHAAYPHLFLQTVFEFPVFDRYKNAFGFDRAGAFQYLNGFTVAQVIAGGDEVVRKQIYQKLLSADTKFSPYSLQDDGGNKDLFGHVILTLDLLQTELTGATIPPKFSSQFPARLHTSSLNWNDLVLHSGTRNQLEDLVRWLEYGPTVVDKMQGRLKLGIKALLYGPPGTGKSLAVALMGKRCKRSVYRIDLSQLVSKFIGETEKNLARIFDLAETQNWILFFDEADAVFGKRTETRDAHDKYANQETSYLLMRLEEHPAPVILASNFRENIDAAFQRRFGQIIYFPSPGAEERLQLWQKALPSDLPLDSALNWSEIAKKYELTGAQITNIVGFSLMRVESGLAETLNEELLRTAISIELAKERRTI